MGEKVLFRRTWTSTTAATRETPRSSTTTVPTEAVTEELDKAMKANTTKS
jgi:hypothetical protein